jgi:hypothetical protein
MAAAFRTAHGQILAEASDHVKKRPAERPASGLILPPIQKNELNPKKWMAALVQAI